MAELMIRCPNCEGEIVPTFTDDTFERDGRRFVFKTVPAHQCTKCKEEFFDAYAQAVKAWALERLYDKCLAAELDYGQVGADYLAWTKQVADELPECFGGEEVWPGCVACAWHSCPGYYEIQSR